MFYLDDYKNGQNWKVVQKVQHRHLWDILEKDNTTEVDGNFDETVEDDAYQENESCDIEWSFGLDDQLGLQRFDRKDVNPEVINNNILSMGDRNDDDDFICEYICGVHTLRDPSGYPSGGSPLIGTVTVGPNCSFLSPP